MYLPAIVFEVMKSLGYRETEELWDFWSREKSAIISQLNLVNPALGQITEAQMRWKSPIGQDGQRAIRKFIEEFKAKLDASRQNAYNQGDVFGRTIPESDRTLDFASFAFVSGGRQYTLNDFQNLTTAQVYPHANLSGIDLRGIRLTSCIIRLACLTYANLDDSHLQQIDLVGTRLNGASIRDSHIGQLRFVEGGMANADVSGSLVNAVQLDDRTVSDSLQYSEITYRELMWLLLNKFMGLRSLGRRFNERARYTEFLANNTSSMTNPENKPFKSYVMWFQFATARIREYNTLAFRDKMLFTASLVFTKGWNSYAVLASWGAIVVIGFALCYHLNLSRFNNLDSSFLSAVYFSVVTFATLGYGDITPKPGFGQVIVMIEVVIGYLTLGSFAFLIGHKVSNRF